MTLDRRLVPFKSWHFEWMQSESAALKSVSPDDLKPCEKLYSWTGVVDGKPIGCAGVVTQWPGRHVLWAYLRPDTGPHMLWITRQVKERLALYEGRLEMTVRADFAAGLRWAGMLGFTVETPVLTAYGPEGEDHVGYIRINR